MILLVFLKDRKLRIETGYGLEGVLTDALCSSIINYEIVPLFKNGNFFEGIQAGITAIIKATAGEYQAKKPQKNQPGIAFFIIIFSLMIILSLLSRYYQKQYGMSSNGLYGSRGRHGSYGGWSNRGSSGFGGFSGGGGSFGGGGSSGSW